jgi:hypothetical protein
MRANTKKELSEYILATLNRSLRPGIFSFIAELSIQTSEVKEDYSRRNMTGVNR